MEINNFDVEIYTELGTKYVKCNNDKQPGYHIAHIVRLAHKFRKIYEIDLKDLILEDNIFNMVVKFEDLERLYNELYKIK